MSTFHKIVITGGSSGLGLALARHYARQGAAIALVAREERKLAQAAAELSLLGAGLVLHRSIDVTNADAAQRDIPALIEELGGIDLLINSAGILKEGYFHDLPASAFEQVMAVNVFGLINTVRAALPAIETSRGQITNVASLGGFAGAFGYTPYCTSKFAVVGFTECLRAELKPRGVKVQLLCPPEFDSPMVDTLDAYRTPENRACVLSIPKMSIEAVTEASARCIASNQFTCFPGSNTRAAAWAFRHLPSLARRMIDRTIAKVYVGPKARV